MDYIFTNKGWPLTTPPEESEITQNRWVWRIGSLFKNPNLWIQTIQSYVSHMKKHRNQRFGIFETILCLINPPPKKKQKQKT